MVLSAQGSCRRSHMREGWGIGSSLRPAMAINAKRLRGTPWGVKKNDMVLLTREGRARDDLR